MNGSKMPFMGSAVIVDPSAILTDLYRTKSGSQSLSSLVTRPDWFQS